MKHNVFTNQILDIVLPNSNNLEECPGIFLILEYVECDVWKLLNVQELTDFEVDHVRTIMYNLLCSVQYIHSANLMHRDLKPGNILVDDNCHIKLCDFG